MCEDPLILSIMLIKLSNNQKHLQMYHYLTMLKIILLYWLMFHQYQQLLIQMDLVVILIYHGNHTFILFIQQCINFIKIHLMLIMVHLYIT